MSKSKVAKVMFFNSYELKKGYTRKERKYVFEKTKDGYRNMQTGHIISEHDLFVIISEQIGSSIKSGESYMIIKVIYEDGRVTRIL